MVFVEKGYRGSLSSQVLLDAIISLFAPKSGDVYWQYGFHPCEIEIAENKGERMFLYYTEYISKNQQRKKTKIENHFPSQKRV